MERFAKRKLIMMPAKDMGVRITRIFFKQDMGRTFHLIDLPEVYSNDMKYEKAKWAMCFVCSAGEKLKRPGIWPQSTDRQ